MLSSSAEYIKALREGKYLLFLDWVNFITEKYTENKDLEAGDLVNILIFEWLSNEYSDEDAKKVALLYAVYDLNEKPLQRKLDYSFNQIVSALFLCMVLKSNNLSIHCEAKPSCKKLNQSIDETISKLDQCIYVECLEKMQAQFFEWVHQSDKKEIDSVYQKVICITKPRYQVEDYIFHLELIKINQDPLYTTRLNIAKRFLSYLYEQIEMTPKVSIEILEYINAIREMRPSPYEETKLDSILPPSTLETTRRWVTGLAFGFFKLVLKEKTVDEIISGKPETPNANGI